MSSRLIWNRKSSLNVNKTTGNHEIVLSEKEKEKDNKSDRKNRFLSKLRASFHKAKSFDHEGTNQKLNDNDKNNFKSDSKHFKRLFSRRSKSLTINNKCSEKKTNDCLKGDVDSIHKSISNEETNVKLFNGYVSKKEYSLWGIMNHGNTCYINSIIQCLNSIDKFAKYFVLKEYKADISITGKGNKDKNLKLLTSLSKLLFSLWESYCDPDLLAKEFKTALSKSELIFCSNDQQDAQELLLFLLNYCHEALKTEKPSTCNNELKTATNLQAQARLIRTENQSKIHELFATYQQITISCPNCHEKQKKLEQNLCLSLPVPARTMEPLYYCFVEKDGSQISAAMWINIVSTISYVRIAIAHKFRVDSNFIVIMAVSETGFGKFFQDNECAGELLVKSDSSPSPNGSAISSWTQEVPDSNGSNVWNGIVAVELSSMNSGMSTNRNNFCNGRIQQHQTHQKPPQQLRSNRKQYSTEFWDRRTGRRSSGHYDNIMTEELENSEEDEYIYGEDLDDEELGLEGGNNYRNGSFNNSYTNIPDDESSNSYINLVVTHVEEIIESSKGSSSVSWRRFSAPLSLLVSREVEFADLETFIIKQLESVFQTNIQTKLKSHLKLFAWDGVNKSESEITIDHQFPLLTESAEQLLPIENQQINGSVSGISLPGVLRLIVVWAPINAARLMQSVFCNLRLFHSLNRSGGPRSNYSSLFDTSAVPADPYNYRRQHPSRSLVSSSASSTQSLSLIDAWPSPEENGSVEVVKREALALPGLSSNLSANRTLSLDDCLKAYMTDEVLDAKDAWRCPECKQMQRATVSTAIYSLPEVLVLHLKRFQSHHHQQMLLLPTAPGPGANSSSSSKAVVGGGSLHQKKHSVASSNTATANCNNSNNKLNILVDYPITELDMTPYLSPDIDIKHKHGDRSNLYDLVAVCNHQGTISTGHYTAFCKSSLDSKWRLFNDESVREILLDSVIQPNAYILFYLRRSSAQPSEIHWSAMLNSSPVSYSHTNADQIINGDVSQTIHEVPSFDSDVSSNDKCSNENLHDLLLNGKLSSSSKYGKGQCNGGSSHSTNHNPENITVPPITHNHSSINNQSNRLQKTGYVTLSNNHSNIRKPLPLDVRCNSIRNNTPILHEEDDREEEEEEEEELEDVNEYLETWTRPTILNNSNISSDESITARPLRLKFPR